MLYTFFMCSYFISTFIFLILLSISHPRISQNPKLPKLFCRLSFTLFYAINMFCHFYLFEFSILMSIIINVGYLLSAQVLGYKLRLVGLSGQICSGKTTAAEYLNQKYMVTIIDYKEILLNTLKLPDVRLSIQKNYGDHLFKNINMFSSSSLYSKLL